jgi:hypothetical protein
MSRLSLFLRTAFILVAALALAAGATFLPDNPYQRFQLLDDTIYSRARWSYERLHFDPRPVDVAIVGDSKALIGLRAETIEQRLAADGKPANVVNMALEGDGRDQQWAFVQELLRTKRPKVIVLAINAQPYPWGHDSFRYIAPASEIRREAFLGLHDGRKDLMFLPFRQMKLFAAMLAPGPFGLTDRFDQARYAATPRDYLLRHQNSAGEWIDFHDVLSAEALREQARKNAEAPRRSRLPAAVRGITDADDRVYTTLIARAAAAHGAKLLFVYQPNFEKPEPIANRPFYASLGVIQDDTDLAGQAALFHDWAHVNTSGMQIVSDRVADDLAKMLP